MSAITLPAEYGLVGAAITAAGFLNLWQAHLVGKARKLAKIDYPQMYAEAAQAKASSNAQKFNCTQRAHQNTLENVPIILAGTAYLGVAHPKFAAASLGLWIVARVIYTVGYSSGEPKNRATGAAMSGISTLVVLIGCGWTAYESISALL